MRKNAIIEEKKSYACSVCGSSFEERYEADWCANRCRALTASKDAHVKLGGVTRSERLLIRLMAMVAPEKADEAGELGTQLFDEIRQLGQDTKLFK